MDLDRAYIEPLYLLALTKKCLRTFIKPGLIFHTFTLARDNCIRS